MTHTGGNVVICCDGTGQTIRAAAPSGQSARLEKTNVAEMDAYLMERTRPTIGFFCSGSAAAPHVRNNEFVEVVRHAVAIDERRSAFQVTGWSDRVLRDLDVSPAELDHRIREVWFAGPRLRSTGCSERPLAKGCGLRSAVMPASAAR